MIPHSLHFTAVGLIALGLYGQIRVQAEAREDTLLSTTGTITLVSPGSLVLTTEKGSVPSRYTVTRATQYLDGAGSAQSLAILRPDLAATVYYVKEGDQLLAQKVVLGRGQPAAANAPTVRALPSTTATVMAVTPSLITLHSVYTTTPLRYTVAKTTQCVNATCQPVSFQAVKPGMPVTVYYLREGVELVANRVLIRSAEPTFTKTDHPDGSASEPSPSALGLRSREQPFGSARGRLAGDSR